MSKLKEFVFNKVMSIFIFNISKKKNRKEKKKYPINYLYVIRFCVNVLIATYTDICRNNVFNLSKENGIS